MFSCLDEDALMVDLLDCLYANVVEPSHVNIPVGGRIGELRLEIRSNQSPVGVIPDVIQMGDEIFGGLGDWRLVEAVRQSFEGKLEPIPNAVDASDDTV